LPADATDRHPLILLGHGGDQHKEAPRSELESYDSVFQSPTASELERYDNHLLPTDSQHKTTRPDSVSRGSLAIGGGIAESLGECGDFATR
jgi:hypothetical protein